MKLTAALRLVSCALWGISGIIAIPTSPIVGGLSILSAALFFTAIVMEM